ncbi:MAG: response regulator [Verrucomicrobiota bacterium]
MKKTLPHIGKRLPKATATVLVVEDDLEVLGVFRAMLEKLGFRVFPAESETEVFSEYAHSPSKVDVLLIDIGLHGLDSGFRIAANFRAANPTLKVVFTSGRPAEHFDDPSLIPGFNFLPKPFTFETLARILERAGIMFSLAISFNEVRLHTIQKLKMIESN